MPSGDKFANLRSAVDAFEDAIDAYWHTNDKAAAHGWIEDCRDRVEAAMALLIVKEEVTNDEQS